MRHLRLTPLAVGATALLTLTACTADGPAQEAAPAPTPSVTYTAEVPVTVPGRPGEAAETVAPGETGAYEDPTVYNDADVRFVRDMIVHHQQALEMSALAPDRAADDAVRRMAERIEAGQGPEIEWMRSWLESQGLPVEETGGDAHAGHGGGHGGHEGMAGMASAADLSALAAADGAEFDRRFLELMIAHHEGALTMASDVTAEGRNVLVQETAADVSVTQTVEIDRMREVLGRL